MIDTNWNAVYGFWLVAEHGSFRKAAEALPWGSVQALHKRVRQLENSDSLNVKLLRSRGVKGVELTEAGRSLHRLLNSVFRPFDQVVSELRAEDVGNLNIGLSNYASFNYLPAILPAFHRRFPRVSVRLRIGETDEVLGMLERAEYDLGICSPPERHHSLMIKAWHRMPLSLLVPMGHRLTREMITWERLLQEPIIIFERTTSLRHSLETLLTRLGLFVKLHVSAEVPRVDLAIAAVRSGMGVAIVPLGTEYRKLIEGLQELEPPKGLPEIGQAVIYREDRYVPRYMKVFIEIASRVIIKRTEASLRTRAKVRRTRQRAG
jgi:DNA-binding transcriptional LysR family regulator